MTGRYPDFPQAELSPQQREVATAVANAAQKMRKQFQAATDTMELRKWCVEKAIAAAPGGTVALVEDGPPQKIEFATLAIARDIFTFITAPLAEKADTD